MPGEWEFNESVSRSFDSRVSTSKPLYNEVQQMVVEMSEWFVSCGINVYDVDCSAGDTISLPQRKHACRENAKFIGIDNSRSVIVEARKK